MRAPIYCAWCQAEGKPAFLRWTDTSDGMASHGICQCHQEQLLKQLAVYHDSQRDGNDGARSESEAGIGQHHRRRPLL